MEGMQVSKVADLTTSHVDKAELSVSDAGTISGYAALWGVPDKIGDVFTPESLRKTVAERIGAGKVMLRVVHVDKDGSVFKNIASVAGATEDKKGLWITAKLFDLAAAQDARTMVKAAPNAFGLSTSTRIIGRPIRNEFGGRTFTENAIREITLTDQPLEEGTRGLKAASEGAGNPHTGAPTLDVIGDRIRREGRIRQFTLRRYEG
jgi:HK97 family phage prohead protease